MDGRRRGGGRESNKITGFVKGEGREKKGSPPETDTQVNMELVSLA